MNAIMMPYPPRPVGSAPSALLDDTLAIAWDRFTLPNGLTVIVHENRTVPLVTVDIWYKVGSKDEPPGKTGLAHLFEHLMFGGSANMPGSYIDNMAQLGAIDLNGSTSPDRTNFYQTVETGALDAALFAESDRMGHFLETLSEEVLEKQRSVVLNEKEQTGGGPHGGVQERIARGLYPVDHPYAHTTIGWREDIESLTLEDARDWFRRHYGPTNAVLVLAGDIDLATARAKAAQFFGDIPPGPPQARPMGWMPAPRGERREVMEDRVPHARVTLAWHAPPMGTPTGSCLSVAMPLLGDGPESRLHKRLVDRDGLASRASASLMSMLLSSRITVSATLAEGADILELEAAMRDEVARFCHDGIDQDELDRVRIVDRAGVVRSHQTSQDVAELLAMNEVYFGDPGRLQAELAWIAGATTDEIRAALAECLGRAPDYVLHVMPRGEPRAEGVPLDRRLPPRVRGAKGISLPPTREGRLSNGVRVIVAERHDVPLVESQLVVPRGIALEPRDRLGATELMSALLHRGVGDHDADALRELTERHAISLGGDVGQDISSLSLSAMRSRLDLALDLHADMVRRPHFDAAELEAARARQLTGLRSADHDAPGTVAGRLLRRLMFGDDHPYARPDGGHPATLAAVGRDDLLALHRRIFDPAGATFVVVGDTDLDAMLPRLEARFGDWPAASGAAPAIPPARTVDPAVYLIDRPGSAQSFVAAALLIPSPLEISAVELPVIHSTLGGTFGSRLNMNLREDKNWTYGVQTEIGDTLGERMFVASGAFQGDRTADSMMEILREYTEMVTTQPFTEEMLVMGRQSMIQVLPKLVQTLGAVMKAIVTQVTLGLPLDYWSGHAARIDAIEVDAVNALARRIIRPDQLVWVVVGDRAAIEADIVRAGFGPVRHVAPDGELLYR